MRPENFSFLFCMKRTILLSTSQIYSISSQCKYAWQMRKLSGTLISLDVVLKLEVSQAVLSPVSEELMCKADTVF